MTLIDKFDIVDNPNMDILLTKEQTLAAFKLFAEGKKSQTIRRKLFIPTDKLDKLYERLLEVKDMLYRIVRHEAFLVKEEFHYEIDKDTQEQIKVVDVEAVLCPVPKTLEKLIERSIELIGKDYDISEPLFAATSVDELIEVIEEAITIFVTHSNVTNDATYEYWKSNVIGG